MHANLRHAGAEPPWDHAVLLISSLTCTHIQCAGAEPSSTHAVLLSSGDAWELERCDCVLSSDVSCGGQDHHRLLQGFASGRCVLSCPSTGTVLVCICCLSLPSAGLMDP